MQVCRDFPGLPSLFSPEAAGTENWHIAISDFFNRKKKLRNMVHPAPSQSPQISTVVLCTKVLWWKCAARHAPQACRYRRPLVPVCCGRCGAQIAPKTAHPQRWATLLVVLACHAVRSPGEGTRGQAGRHSDHSVGRRLSHRVGELKARRPRGVGRAEVDDELRDKAAGLLRSAGRARRRKPRVLQNPICMAPPT